MSTNRRVRRPLSRRLLAMAGTAALAGSVALSAAAPAAAVVRNPAQLEADWIVSTQFADGAIPTHPDDMVIMPYYANLAATSILRYSSASGAAYHTKAKAWIQWYFNHMNIAADKFGLEGSMYDWKFSGGTTTGLMYWKETSATDSTLIPANGPVDGEPDYDSSDSYAATLMSLANAYWDTPGSDHAFITSNRYFLTFVMNALTTTIDTAGNTTMNHVSSDNLSWAKPLCVTGPNRPRFGCVDRSKYLMDNAEVAKGLKDAAALWQKAFRPGGTWVDGDASYSYALWNGDATLVQNATLTTLKRTATSATSSLEFYTSREPYVAGYPEFPTPSYTVWYADSAAQAWPTLFGLLTPTHATSVAVRTKLNARWAACARPVKASCARDWPTMKNVDAPTPWTEIGYFSAVTGPHTGAVSTDTLALAQDAYVRANLTNVVGVRPGGWDVREAGWYIRLREQLGDTA
jgi:hypothetical protein